MEKKQPNALGSLVLFLGAIVILGLIDDALKSICGTQTTALWPQAQAPARPHALAQLPNNYSPEVTSELIATEYPLIG